MEYKFRDIEKKWQEWWKANKVYKVSNESTKPKCYVLDMFPYPSGAGLHVGHPLGYIASDIYSRYKRLKGFNVLHPMGFDSFGLPAEQYALDTGQHPAETTKKNIATFKAQLDNIGFCYDWDREVKTSDPQYYKWTQWIFLQLFNSYYDRKEQKAKPISGLIKTFETEGTANCQLPTANSFSADEWKAFDEKQKMDVLMDHRLAFCGYGEVNWCEALGTVLANDEVVNGVSERGGHPVVKKKLRQWYLRITEYADRLLEGLNKVDFSEAMKEMQTNWIGKSSGAEIDFEIKIKPPLTPPKGENTTPKYQTAQPSLYSITKRLSEEKRKNPTHEEQIMWQLLRANKTGFHIRRQHIIGSYIVDFACLNKLVTIEIDGGYHNNPEIQFYDKERTAFLKASGFTELRFTNEEVRQDSDTVVKKIIEELSKRESISKKSESSEVSPSGGDLEGASLTVYTTRPDTIFGVDFMVIAPEHELVEQIKSEEQTTAVDEYIAYVKSRSERERMAEKKISGVFTGAYAINPFDGREIPIWVSEYVLAGYGTGAIMGVPCGDERDHKFAKHFNIPVTNIIGKYYNDEEASPTKDAILENSDFINGLVMKDAIEVIIKKIEELGIGARKVNYKMRDAAFSRQRYWGEPFPIKWINGIAYPLDESELPLELPHVDSYKPGPDGEGPLANIREWVLIPNPSPSRLLSGEKGAARVPKYAVHTPRQYELAKEMRKGHTEAEGILWELLRSNKLGVKFRRQHPVDAYIVDFICLQEKLIIEVDGGYHNTEDQKKYDEERTSILNQIGFDVIRFTNEEVIEHPYQVKEKIKSELGRRIPSPPVERGQAVRETNTMPGYAGSSWYFLRYMDPHNDKTFCDRKASDYWNQVDLYIGGTEHAVGHLLYSRMWTKVLYDLGLIGFDEPYKKLVNQGMIQGSSRFVYRVLADKKFYSKNIFEKHINQRAIELSKQTELPDWEKRAFFQEIHVDVNIVDGLELDIEAFKKWKPEYANAEFILDNGKYICGSEIEKMSKSKFNTVNPDDLVAKYGADTFRMYEMFLGPVEMSKPWDTKGIEGVHRFLKKFWRLFADEDKGLPAGRQGLIVTNEKATAAELKVLHNAIKKIESDTERFSFNTAVSAFMIATNELADLKCHKRSILEPLLILLAPYAPHIAEELYNVLGSSKVPSPSGEGVGGEVSILNAPYPLFEEKYVTETAKEYPISVNGKLRTTMNLSLDAAQPEVEKLVLENEVVKKWLEGKQVKKIIYVKEKMVNIVI